MASGTLEAQMDDAEKKNGYTAPALEKGLDILELLAESEGLSQLHIAKHLGRTATEVFRMINVLERRGYIRREPDGRYVLAMKLYELSHRNPPTRLLLNAALPMMRQLADDCRQSVHLVVHHDQRVLVIAQVDSPEPLNFGVRLGAHFPLQRERTSSLVLTAFAAEPLRSSMIDTTLANDKHAYERHELETELHRIRENGCFVNPSRTTTGVIDVSCPIRGVSEGAIAAMTAPYLRQTNIDVTIEDCTQAVRRSAAALSTAIGFVDV